MTVVVEGGWVACVTPVRNNGPENLLCDRLLVIVGDH